jgi:hypothetical protein
MARACLEDAETILLSPVITIPKTAADYSHDVLTARIQIAEENGHAIYAEFHSPSIADRERVSILRGLESRCDMTKGGLSGTKELMGALVRMKPKPHEDMRLWKKQKVTKKRRGVSAKRKIA